MLTAWKWWCSYCLLSFLLISRTWALDITDEPHGGSWWPSWLIVPMIPACRKNGHCFLPAVVVWIGRFQLQIGSMSFWSNLWKLRFDIGRWPFKIWIFLPSMPTYLTIVLLSTTVGPHPMWNLPIAWRRLNTSVNFHRTKTAPLQKAVRYCNIFKIQMASCFFSAGNPPR